MYFITGNIDKFKEICSNIPSIKQLDIDLPEIQETDAYEIIKEKLRASFAYKQDEFIVEDTSLYCECLNGLPGPLIKWFLKSLGTEGLFRIVQTLGNTNAIAKSIIGYARNYDEIYFFEGILEGKLVAPRGINGFGWDSIFVPDGNIKTFAEMDENEKNNISMRRVALNKFKEFIA
jgi:inosine triphosphate pyrophosphatase